MEPHGHFPVEQGIEDKVLNPRRGLPADVATEVNPSNLAKALGSDADGVFVNRAMKKPANYVAFSGQGHSLMSSAPSEAASQPLEGVSNMETECDEAVPMREPLVRRLGPGYSVIDHESSNQTNTQTDLMMNIASQLESLVNDAQDDDTAIVDIEDDNEVHNQLNYVLVNRNTNSPT